MDDIYALRQQASELRKQKKYHEALELFKILWEEHRDQCNEWDGWGYAYSLRKVGNASLACKVSEEVYEHWPEFEYNQSLLAWTTYDVEIKKDIVEIKQNESNYFEAVNKILSLVEFNTYSPYGRTIFKVIDYLEESRNNYPAESINNWLERLNPKELSLETWTGKDQKGRPLEHASKKENWYAKRAKALYELGRYQDCIETSQEAFEMISAFHYRNEKWIKRLIALSYYELGQFEEGLKWLKQIFDHRPEWFLHLDMALFLSQTGNQKEAIKHAAVAALDPQELGFKWNVFYVMGKILFDQGELELAKKHLLLAYKVREDNEWSIPKDLQKAIEKVNLDTSEAVNAHKLEKNLRGYWQSLKVADMEKMTGTIKNMVSSGRSGFISGNDGREYYFPVKNFKGDSNQLQTGIEVSFYVRPTDQPGKLDTAVNITTN